jgi:hypothetical protein
MLASFPFPYKVHVILERGFHCITWCGPNSFRLVDPDEFEKILPHFFKHEKLSSFTRQLNIYGFHKIREGPLKGSYTHEDFMRGDLERVSSIPRAKRSGPREEMKVRESRNASVIYSTMMMHQSMMTHQSNPTDDESSGTDYASDSSRASRAGASAFIDCNLFESLQPNTKTMVKSNTRKMDNNTVSDIESNNRERGINEASGIETLQRKTMSSEEAANPDRGLSAREMETPWLSSKRKDNNDVSDIESNKRKRYNNDVSDSQPRSSSLAILEKARFVYKERSYAELKSQTEKNDSKCLPGKIQVHHLVKEEILISRKPEFESESDFEDDEFSDFDLSDCDLSDCDFSVLPLARRSITQQIAEESERCDVKVDAPAILKSEPTPQTASAELDPLDEFAEESERCDVMILSLRS